MIEQGKIKKTLKPSERESITAFASTFGTGENYEKRAKRKSLFFTLCIVAALILVAVLGFLITEVFIDITELPVV